MTAAQKRARQHRERERARIEATKVKANVARVKREKSAAKRRREDAASVRAERDAERKGQKRRAKRERQRVRESAEEVEKSKRKRAREALHQRARGLVASAAAAGDEDAHLEGPKGKVKFFGEDWKAMDDAVQAVDAFTFGTIDIGGGVGPLSESWEFFLDEPGDVVDVAGRTEADFLAEPATFNLEWNNATAGLKYNEASPLDSIVDDNPTYVTRRMLRRFYELGGDLSELLKVNALLLRVAAAMIATSTTDLPAQWAKVRKWRDSAGRK